MGAMILAEIGGFSRFSSPDKLLAHAGLSPSANQSGKLNNAYAHMEKRGSRYLRYALFNAPDSSATRTPACCLPYPTEAEGKHYNVAIFHATKKLIRLIFTLVRSRQSYSSATA